MLPAARTRAEVEMVCLTRLRQALRQRDRAMRALFSSCVCLILFVATNVAEAQNRKGWETPSAALSRMSDPLLAWAVVWGDTKGEGVYTCEEWKQYATRIFNNADRNHDGYVDAQEFEAIRNADPMFKSADLAYFDDNRDGRLSRSEFVDKPNPFFARYDKKGTCKVTSEDISETLTTSHKSGRAPTR
jgi:hypothetical protein